MLLFTSVDDELIEAVARPRPRYDCVPCRDTGYIEILADLGVLVQWIACPFCDTARERAWFEEDCKAAGQPVR